MKKNVVMFLKNFIDTWNKKGNAKSVKFSPSDDSDLQEYILIFQNILSYNEVEKLYEENVKISNISFNDRLVYLYTKNTEEYNELLKKYPKMIETIKTMGRFYTENNFENEFLDFYNNYIFDKNENILEYKVICATNSIRAHNKRTNSFISIEQFIENDNEKLVLSPSSNLRRAKNLKYTFCKVNKNKYVEEDVLLDGTYNALDNLRTNQSRAYILDLKTGEEVIQNYNSNEILNEIRHNASAHNNIYNYYLKKLPEIKEIVLLFENKNTSILLDRNIFFNILREIFFLTKTKSNEFYYLYFPNKTEKICEENLLPYLKQCVLLKLTFNEVVCENVFEDFIAKIIDDYKKIKKEEREKTDLFDYIKNELNIRYNLVAKIEQNNIYLDKIYEIILKKSITGEIKILSEAGEFFSTLIKFYGLNILDKKTLFGYNKDYTFKPSPQHITKAILNLLYYVKMKQENLNLWNETFSYINKDCYFISIIYFLIYINFIQNKLIDNLKKCEITKNNDKKLDEILERVIILDQNDKIFVFSPKNENNYRPKTKKDYLTILRMIRNSIAHNNFAINYVNSYNIMDANIYFLNSEKTLKIICTVKNFLNFITNDIFTNYFDEKDMFVGENFEEITKLVFEKFKKNKDNM